MRDQCRVEQHDVRQAMPADDRSHFDTGRGTKHAKVRVGMEERSQCVAVETQPRNDHQTDYDRVWSIGPNHASHVDAAQICDTGPQSPRDLSANITLFRRWAN